MILSLPFELIVLISLHLDLLSRVSLVNVCKFLYKKELLFHCEEKYISVLKEMYSHSIGKKRFKLVPVTDKAYQIFSSNFFGNFGKASEINVHACSFNSLLPSGCGKSDHIFSTERYCYLHHKYIVYDNDSSIEEKDFLDNFYKKNKWVVSFTPNINFCRKFSKFCKDFGERKVYVKDTNFISRIIICKIFGFLNDLQLCSILNLHVDLQLTEFLIKDRLAMFDMRDRFYKCCGLTSQQFIHLIFPEMSIFCKHLNYHDAYAYCCGNNIPPPKYHGKI